MGGFPMSNETQQLRMDVAQDRFDAAMVALRVEFREFSLDYCTRIPDQDDWDDTLNATAWELEQATDGIKDARKVLKEGS
jgi:hypothetical protein